MNEEGLNLEVYTYENGIATITARTQRMLDALAVLNNQENGGFIMDENGQELARTGTVPVTDGGPVVDPDPVVVPDGS